MILAGACYYHPSPFGSGPPIWGCDLGTIPDPPTWLIQAFDLLALVALALGVLTVILGRNLLPWGKRLHRCPVAWRVQGLSEIVGSILLVAATTALAKSRNNPVDPRLELISLIGFPVMAGLWALAWYLDRQSPRRPSPA